MKNVTVLGPVQPPQPYEHYDEKCNLQLHVVFGKRNTTAFLTYTDSTGFTYQTVGEARCSPEDSPVLGIGEFFAVARAMKNMGRYLYRAAVNGMLTNVRGR